MRATIRSSSTTSSSPRGRPTPESSPSRAARPAAPTRSSRAWVAQAGSIDPKQVNDIAGSGGGEALAAILGGKVAAGISGVREFTDHVAAGKMRALAVSGTERVESFDAPTIKESGLDVELTSWRGMVAPGGISDADKQALSDAVEKRHASDAWQPQMEKNGWGDAFLPDDEFTTFLAEEKTRVSGVLKSLGLV